MYPLSEIDTSAINSDELKRKRRVEEQELTTCSNCSYDLNEISFNSASCDSGIGASSVSQSPLIVLDNQELSDELRESSHPSLQEASDRKKYETIAWIDLTTEVREAAKLLGYTEEMWDESKEPEVSKKYWSELGSDEKVAAKVLGYDETQWNFASKDVTPKDYDDMFWNQLPKNIRKAYRVLGYSKRIWNDDDAPSSFDKDWHELTEPEQRAATIVGYTAETWDEEEDKQPRSIKEESVYFIRGASYIMLECIATAAFSGCIKMVFSVGKHFLDKSALNAFKIVIGLAIMQFSGQIHRWLHGEEEQVTRGRRGAEGDQPALFRSFLNLFSWWTTFAGVEYFVGAFENDMLYKYVETKWYYNLCELEDKVNNVCQEVLSNATVTATENITCSNVVQLPKWIEWINMVEDYIVESLCGLLDDEREVVGQVYYWTLFIGSAVSMWYVFDDNFLHGCDTD